MNSGVIYLVGAGPGDPGLLTCRAVETLQQADVVLYDRLLDNRVLEHATTAELVFVGKRPDRHPVPQEEINALLIARARRGETVVRLKGGDPFVFGRGGEEALAARAAGLQCEIVPGITSAIAAPAYAGIPVTHRGLATGVTIVTGHEDPAKPDSQVDWQRLAAGEETLVVLMGMARLKTIAQTLIAHGRAADTPVAVIENGTHPEQRSVVGTLASIDEQVQRVGLGSPAVVVVGTVAALAQELAWLPERPLAGRRVVVTRAQAQAGKLARLLRNSGAYPIEVPVIETAPPEDPGALDAALGNLAGYDAVVFVSVNAVEACFERMRGVHRLDARALAGLEIWALGSRTVEALKQRGIDADLTPHDHDLTSLFERESARAPSGRRYLLPRGSAPTGEGGSLAIAEALATRGARVDEVSAYRSVPVAGVRRRLQRLLEEKRIDAITFTSSSAVQSFAAEFPAAELAELCSQSAIASIGPLTSATAREVGLPPKVEAADSTLTGLLEALIAHCAADTRGAPATRGAEAPYHAPDASDAGPSSAGTVTSNERDGA